MRFIQFFASNGARTLGTLEHDEVRIVPSISTLRELALDVLDKDVSLDERAAQLLGDRCYSYAELLEEGRILPPIDHPDPAHCFISGTGLTHLGSADARNKMHQQGDPHDDAAKGQSDSMRMFQWGVAGGKPGKGQTGVQPEWFYKGDGQMLIAPGAAFTPPAFAEDAGEESEIAGIYVIGRDGVPYRLGFCLGNEFSDHVMERENYLYLAHSKLRQCSLGPAAVSGPLPDHVVGVSRIVRRGQMVWEREFLSGERNMSHSIGNLEHHHFKYVQFRRPGDVHIHFFGTATLSFADGVRLQDGDRFEISSAHFGPPLVNGIVMNTGATTAVAVSVL